MKPAVSVMACLTLLGCAAVPAHLNMPAPSTIHDVRVEITGVLRSGGIGGGIAGLRGVATNVGDETLQFCIVTLELLDPSGAKIGNAMATTQHLSPGVPWKFDAYNAGTIRSAIDRVTLVAVQTDKSLFEGIAKGKAYDPSGLARLKPGETTLAQATDLLGAEPTAKNYGNDGSITAVWSAVTVNRSNIQSRQTAILFDTGQRMVRILSETSTGSP